MKVLECKKSQIQQFFEIQGKNKSGHTTPIMLYKNSHDILLSYILFKYD